MRRIGTRTGIAKTRGRRVVVWHFVCDVCGKEADAIARRRPSLIPEEGEIPAQVCCEFGMSNLGLFFLEMTNGEKVLTEATKLRKEWEAARFQLLRGKMCTCDHWRLYHAPRPPFPCWHCSCEVFRPKPITPMRELGHDSEVPF